jgi:uncharacterized protein YraI
MKTTPRLLGHAICQVVGIGVLLGATTGAFAKPAYVAATVNLRAAPGIKSEVVTKIPGGSLIDADNCTEGWCAVTWQDKSGFAKQTALDMSGRVPQRHTAQARVRSPQEPVYEDGPEYVAEAPAYYDPPPPAYYYGFRPYYGRYWGWRHRW